DAATIELPPYFVDTQETRDNMVNYLAEITYYDGQVGEALALLDKHEVADNTLVIVVSEQGSSFPFAKWTCYDSGLQSAFIARWPKKIRPGSVSDAMIEYLDVLPTYIEAAGGTPPQKLDGKSLLPVLLGKKTRHKDYVYGEMTTRGINNGSDYFGIRSIRSKQFKYVWNFTPEEQFQNAATRGVMWDSWVAKAAGDPDAAERVYRYQNRPGEELYDITTDQYEWTNLADNPEYAEIKADLRQRLLDWMEEMGDEGQQTELEALEHLAKNM
ncbi:MAG: sulfatase-like hydrolase/transferase, partial [Planctomycetes bacterium]|nr:sulfatase-like hydrolase/transferase [Planctomycetota bacterium]